MDGSVSYKPSENWARDWHKVEDWVVEALERSPGGETVSQVQQALIVGTAHLWVGKRAAIVSIYIDECFTIWLGGGDMAEIQQMTPTIEQYGKSLGADRIYIYGRPGWSRSYLKEHGFKTKWVILEKML